MAFIHSQKSVHDDVVVVAVAVVVAVVTMLAKLRAMPNGRSYAKIGDLKAQQVACSGLKMKIGP